MCNKHLTKTQRNWYKDAEFFDDYYPCNLIRKLPTQKKSDKIIYWLSVIGIFSFGILIFWFFLKNH